jgi:hypothetical protein
VSISPIATGSNSQSQAYFTLSQGGTVIDNFILQQASTPYDKNGVVVDAQQVFVGTGSSSYAKVAVYSQAITMTNGQKLVFDGNDAATTTDNNANWIADLNWTTVNVGSQMVPALSSIELLQTTSSNEIPIGTSFDILATPVAKQLTFLGLQSVPQDELTVQSIGTQTLNINAPSATIAANGTYATTVTVNPAGYNVNNALTNNGFNYVTLTSGDSSAFQFGNGNVAQLYINKDLGTILYKDTTDSNYTYVPGLGIVNVTVPAGTAGGYVASTALTYQYPASPMQNNLNLTVWRTATNNATFLYIKEPVVMNNPSGSSGFGFYQIDLYYNPAGDSNYGNNLYNTVTGTSGTLYTNYTAVAPGLNSNVNFGNGTETNPFVSPGGSVLSSVGSGSISIMYPQSLPLAQWWFGSPNNVTVTTSGSTVSSTVLTPGQNYTLGNGYSVSVTSIGGTASCTGGSEMGGAAVCSPSTASVVTQLDTSSQPLVELDSAASPSDQLIVVGGPYVNSIAAGMTGADSATESPGSSVVTVIGNQVLVAGYTAADTTDAANALIAWLAQNRGTVRGTA